MVLTLSGIIDFWGITLHFNLLAEEMKLLFQLNGEKIIKSQIYAIIQKYLAYFIHCMGIASDILKTWQEVLKELRWDGLLPPLHWKIKLRYQNFDPHPILINDRDDKPALQEKSAGRFFIAVTGKDIRPEYYPDYFQLPQDILNLHQSPNGNYFSQGCKGRKY